MEIEGAGHFINVECAEQFSKAILRTFHRARSPHIISLNNTTTIRPYHRPTESQEDEEEEAKEQRTSDEALRENQSTEHHDSYFWSWNFVQKLFRGGKDEEEHRKSIVIATTSELRQEPSLASLDDINKWAACSDPSLVL